MNGITRIAFIFKDALAAPVFGTPMPSTRPVVVAYRAFRNTARGVDAGSSVLGWFCSAGATTAKCTWCIGFIVGWTKAPAAFFIVFALPIVMSTLGAPRAQRYFCLIRGSRSPVCVLGAE